MSINKFKNAWISTDDTNNGYSLVNEGKTKFNDDVIATKYFTSGYVYANEPVALNELVNKYYVDSSIKVGFQIITNQTPLNLMSVLQTYFLQIGHDTSDMILNLPNLEEFESTYDSNIVGEYITFTPYYKAGATTLSDANLRYNYKLVFPQFTKFILGGVIQANNYYYITDRFSSVTLTCNSFSNDNQYAKVYWAITKSLTSVDVNTPINTAITNDVGQQRFFEAMQQIVTCFLGKTQGKTTAGISKTYFLVKILELLQTQLM